MSIRDLLNQGIRIQGAYQIKKWSDENETYEIFAEGSEFEYAIADRRTISKEDI